MCSWYPPFAKTAKDGHPSVLVIASEIKSLGQSPKTA